MALTITVLEGDETGQELLEQALRVLEPGRHRHRCRAAAVRPLAGAPPATGNGIVHEAAQAMREAGLGIKAATITPEGKDDVGSPNRILREEVGGKVIIRTGRRIPGVTPVAGVHYPISVVRMAVEDAYGAKQWREGDEGSGEEVAYRTEKVTRSTCRQVAEYAFRTADKMRGKVYGGPKWTVSPVYEGMLKEELDAAAQRHPKVPYQPVLIDATYAGLIGGAAELPLVIPALNRDGDCLSDLVMPMFGSIAGAESVLLSFDDDLEIDVAMAGGAARHRAGARRARTSRTRWRCCSRPAPSCTTPGARAREGAEQASRAIYESVLEAVSSGVKTPDLGGNTGTTEFTDRGRGPRAHEARGLGLARQQRLGAPPAARPLAGSLVPSDAVRSLANTCSRRLRTPSSSAASPAPSAPSPCSRTPSSRPGSPVRPRSCAPTTAEPPLLAPGSTWTPPRRLDQPQSNRAGRPVERGARALKSAGPREGVSQEIGRRPLRSPPQRPGQTRRSAPRREPPASGWLEVPLK